MKSNKTLLPFYLVLLILLGQACSNGNSSQENTQATDSSSLQNNVPSDTTQAQLISEEGEEGEADEYHDYNFRGVYIGTNASLKLEIINNLFSFYEGHQLKMKGEVSLNGTEEHMNITLSPYGKNKEMIELITQWGNMEAGTYDVVNYVVWGSDTLFHQMQEYH
jgi:hypothetical protein